MKAIREENSVNRLVKMIVGLSLAFLAPVALAQGALDGRKYVGDVGDKGRPAEEKAVVFAFAEGMFRSSICDQYGFEKGAYTAAQEGGRIRFEARTVSSEHGTNHWSGTLEGGVLQGVLVWQRKPSFFRPNPQPVEKWFRAQLM
jgi:hypothetical protein